AMFIPLLESVSQNTSSADNMGNLAFIIDGIEAIGLDLTLTVVLLVMLFFFSMKGVAKFMERYLSTIYQQFFIKQIRLKSINAIANYSYQSFINADAGRIQNTLSLEVERVVKAYQTYTTMINQL